MTQEITYYCNGCGRSEYGGEIPEKATHGSAALYLIKKDDGVGATHDRRGAELHFCEDCGKRIRDSIIQAAVNQGEVEWPTPKAEPAGEI